MSANLNGMEVHYLGVSPDSVLRWKHEGKTYCLRIGPETYPESPRHIMDYLSIMGCFDSKNNLGDDIDERTPEAFWRNLVLNCVTDGEVLAAIEAGKISDLKVFQNAHCRNSVDLLRVDDGLRICGVPKNALLDEVCDDLTIQDCMVLMEPHAEWLPLYLYDHSGLSMSCGSPIYPFTDSWDLRCVGWIVMMKSVMLDAFGSSLAAEGAWRKLALEIMEEDVAEYNKYLCGEVYEASLYAVTEACAENDHVVGSEAIDLEEPMICNIYGSDILENGLADYIGNGLREAVLTGSVEVGAVVYLPQVAVKTEFRF